MEIYVTPVHGDDQGADDAKRRGAALLLWDEDGWVLRIPGDDDDHIIDGPTKRAALDQSRRIIDRQA